MIKLFRKIRQQQIMENKTSKYFKYAIGEIILVVIGILIALQINNWNEARKTNKVKKQVLLSLKKELEVNSDQIKNTFKYHNVIRDTINKIDISKVDFKNKSSFGFWRGHQVFPLRNSSFQTAIQSGILKDLDITLSESLNNLYTQVQFYNDFSQTVNNGVLNIDIETEKGFQKMFNLIKILMEDIHYMESKLLKGFNDTYDLTLSFLEER